MAARNYGQACSVARFLDQLGSRWTLLIVRDLLVGPRRFKDLLASMPSIGPNLLTTRLRELTDHDIVEKVSDPDNRSSTYAITKKGEELEPVVLAMATWGLHHLRQERSRNETLRPDLLVVAFRAAFRPELAKGIREAYEFHIDETVFFAEIDDGKLMTGLGAAKRPAFVLTTDSETFDKISNGTLDVVDAQRQRLLEISGDQNAYARCAEMCGS